MKTYPASCVHEYVIERIIIDLHSNDSYRGFLGSFSNHDGTSSRDRGWLFSNIKRDRVNKGVAINLVVVYCPLVPGFIRSLVVDISKVSKNRLMLKFNLLIDKTKSYILGANFVECKRYKKILTAPLYPHLQIVPFHLVVVAVRPFP